MPFARHAKVLGTQRANIGKSVLLTLLFGSLVEPALFRGSAPPELPPRSSLEGLPPRTPRKVFRWGPGGGRPPGKSAVEALGGQTPEITSSTK
eukprot:9854403-Alexandrium_andersonii.AAC.1